MKKVTVKNLKAGKTVYYVSALGENSFVTKYLITGRPERHTYVDGSKSDSLFVPCRMVYSNGEIQAIQDTLRALNSFSLLDCNVERQNGYNKHRAFYNKRTADRYCELCKQTGIKFESNISWDWGMDYPLEMDDYYED
ncbi:hypothetical protein Ah1_00064 [Aeromonas phage Ah1]|uniref:Uncharacterized protein n=1 Tax=Aeromonas phage Ah1 TaxID=2053701 RepID=A0A2H4YF56_9CAUD|nr:hypothetical protein KNT77_gp064 [Aeromonas phage Ah1]AUE22605.1 hypothetical protein Ah1_00064 [Aeromonas phage Ah1]